MKTKGLGFMQLTIVVGFCLYYGYYLIAFFGAFAELPPSIDFIKAHLGQFAFFIGSIIGTEGLLLWFRRRDSVALCHKKFFFLVSLLPGSLSPLIMALDALGETPPLPLTYTTTNSPMQRSSAPAGCSSSSAPRCFPSSLSASSAGSCCSQVCCSSCS